MIVDDLPVARPVTIPALREWSGGRGAFSLGPRSRIVVHPRHVAELRSTADLLADELEEVIGRRLPVVGGRRSHAGDIRLCLGSPDRALGREGYVINVGRGLGITARTGTGVFYGTRTLLQLLRQGPEVQAGTARDWPRYPERGLMVANGESYIASFLTRQIAELAYLKLNYLHLHFGDYRWQVESERHPEVAVGEGTCLTKEEVRRIVALAERHHITVVPEIDMPGHMLAALAHHPELRLENASGERAPDKLDITNPAALDFARELIEEYLPLFPGPYWHAGGDEYVASSDYPRFPKLGDHARARYGPGATAADAFNGFVNWLNELVRRHGKTLRIWNDQLGGGRAVEIDPAVVVERWTDGVPTQQLLDRGHRVMNAGWFPTYVATPTNGRLPVDIERGYESWAVHQFYGGEESPPPAATPETIAPGERRNLGSKLHLWWGERPSVVFPVLHPRLRVIAQKTWDSPPPVAGYDDFVALGEQIGHPPGAIPL